MHYFQPIRDVCSQRPGRDSASAVLLLPAPFFVGPPLSLVRYLFSLRLSPGLAYAQVQDAFQGERNATYDILWNKDRSKLDLLRFFFRVGIVFARLAQVIFLWNKK